MGKLVDLDNKINSIIDKKRMDKKLIRGRIGLKAGVILSFSEDTPDDPAKIAKLKAAAKEILGEDI